MSLFHTLQFKHGSLICTRSLSLFIYDFALITFLCMFFSVLLYGLSARNTFPLSALALFRSSAPSLHFSSFLIFFIFFFVLFFLFLLPRLCGMHMLMCWCCVTMAD